MRTHQKDYEKAITKYLTLQGDHLNTPLSFLMMCCIMWINPSLTGGHCDPPIVDLLVDFFPITLKRIFTKRL